MSSIPHTNRLNLINANRDVWLVKVPKYVSEVWEKSRAGSEETTNAPEVAKLKFSKDGKGETEISLEMLNLEPNIPKSHRLDVVPLPQQTLGIFSHQENLTLEGQVRRRFQCRPQHVDSEYVALKQASITKAAQPIRKVQQLDKVVTSYKPVSNHKHNIEQNERRKSEGKKTRADVEKVHEILFAAFEKHQYYNIRDLVKITNQPITYLKEILKGVCNYNLRNPHRNMWELKPEYRHYERSEENVFV